MRKITLVAIAALAATGSFAATPTVSEKGHIVKVTNEVAQKKAVKLQSSASRANEDVTYIADMPLYRNANGFFLGVSEEGYGYSKPWGMLPGRGEYILVPTAGTTGNKWKWSEYGKNEEGEKVIYDYEEEADTLRIPVYPYMQTDSTFIMSTDIAGTERTYSNGALTYLCGGSAAMWGFPESDQLELTGEYGLSSVPYQGGQDHLNVWSGALGFDKTDKKASVNGLEAGSWEQIFDFAKYSDLKMSSFGNIIPASGAPYQMSKVFFNVRGTTTEATPLTVSIYDFTIGEFEDFSTVVKGKLLGKGTVVLPEGNFDAGTNGFMIAEVKAVNALGLATNRPVCTNGQAVYVEVSGLDAETITTFYEIVNGGAYVPVMNEDGRPDAVWNNIYPKHAFVGFNATETANNTNMNVTLLNPWWFPAQDYKTGQLGTEFCMWYVMNFPILYNGFTGDDTFEATFETTGGTESLYPVVEELPNETDIQQLYNDGIMKATTSGDWFKFEVGYNEELKNTEITVTVDALPAGKTGRTGFIDFTGYACDFTITVIQGDGSEVDASISEIKNAGNGISEYYDLQGRKLSAAPAKGLYIERNGSAASTKLAR